MRFNDKNLALAYYAALGAILKPSVDERGKLELAFKDLLYVSFSDGAMDERDYLGQSGSYNLTNHTVLFNMNIYAQQMAGFAFTTLGLALVSQTARAAYANRDLAEFQFDLDYLADNNLITVGNRGYNWGRSELARRSVRGGLTKTWTHVGSEEKRRPEHEQLDGMELGIGEFFPLGTGVLSPHDWSLGSATEWQGCHCFCIYTPSENALLDNWNGE